jgi:hypothetical protein
MLRAVVGLIVAPAALAASVLGASQMLEAQTPGSQPNPLVLPAKTDAVHKGWVRGDRVPLAYRQDRYVVHNWKAAGLTEPPSSYRWLKTEAGLFVLYGTASGFIAEIVSKPSFTGSRHPQ